MVVNAALFQDASPAGAGNGGKPANGRSDAQGGGFASILSGHAEREGGAPNADAGAASSANEQNVQQQSKKREADNARIQHALNSVLQDTASDLTAEALEQEMAPLIALPSVGKGTDAAGENQQGGKKEEVSSDEAKEGDGNGLQAAATLLAMLSGAAPASGATSETTKEISSEAGSLAGVSATAVQGEQKGALQQEGQAQPEHYQAPVSGEASAALEALQQKALQAAQGAQPAQQQGFTATPGTVASNPATLAGAENNQGQAQAGKQEAVHQQKGTQGTVISSTAEADAGKASVQEAAAGQQAANVSSDKKEARQALNGRVEVNGPKAAEEPGAAKQESANGQISGTKTAVVTASLRTAAQGNPGQETSGDAGEKGHSEQKAQNQSQPATEGVMQFTATREASQPAAAPSSTQSALHDSILSQVKEGVVTHDGKGNGEVSIRLNPGELGELKIQVRMDDNRIHVAVQADNKMVKDLLLSNLDSLKEALAGKNFAMDGFNVSTGAGGGFNNPLHEQQREAAQQQAMARSARPAAYAAPERTAVKYVTAEVNGLLDVRF